MADERITTRELPDDEIEDRLLAALRERGAEVTEADLVVASGLPPHQVAPGLRRLLVEYRSHLAVRSDGEILYRFDRRFVRRSARPWAFLRTIARAAWAAFVVGFKVLTGAVLLLYVGVFVLLLLLVMEFSILFSIDGDTLWALAKPNRLARARAFVWSTITRAIGLCQKVFAFIFGPSAVPRDELAEERELLAFVRARQGVVTQAELIAQTGWTSEVADQESTRLVARYGGDVEIEDGQALFTFRDLMATSATSPEAPCPPPCWERLEKPVAVTGNSAQADLGIALVNGYVLLASTVIVPLRFAPALGLRLDSPILRWVLSYVPACYSLAAFLIHLLRRILVIPPENRRRLVRNLRRLLLREAFHDRDTDAEALFEELPRIPVSASAGLLGYMAQAMAVELGAQIDPGDDGRLHFRWTQLGASLTAARTRRARQPAAGKTEVVFSTEDPVK